MLIDTSRFGPLEVDDQRLITFGEGILGFPNNRTFALVQTGEESAFYWLQAVDRPELAFVVCDPRLFVGDYRVPVRKDELSALAIGDPAGAQVFVIVNKIDDQLTGNLQGPLVINVATRQGRQMVLSDKRYSTRHPLIQLAAQQPMGQTA